MDVHPRTRSIARPGMWAASFAAARPPAPRRSPGTRPPRSSLRRPATPYSRSTWLPSATLLRSPATRNLALAVLALALLALSGSVEAALAPLPQAAPFESEISPESPTAPDSDPDDRDQDPTTESPKLREREKLVRGWPLFYKERGPGDREETDAFFLLYHHLRVGTEHSRRVAPFYFSRWNPETNEHDTLLFPFYYSRARGASWRWISLPLDIEHDASEQETRWGAPVLLSLYRGTSSPDGSSHRLGVWPLVDLFATQNLTTRRAVELFGLFSWRGPAESWLPLYRHQSRFGRLEESTLFPLWYYRNRTRGDAPETRWVLPLLGYWHDSTPEETTQYWLPILGRRQVAEDRASWTALFGLLGAGHGPDVRWSRFEPFYSSTTSEDHRSFRILRLYGSDRSKSGEWETTHLLPPLGRFSRTRYGYQHRFFPFYFAGGNHGVASDDPDAPTLPKTSYRAIVPLYYRYESPRIDRRFIFPLYYAATTRSSTEDGSVAEYGNRVGFPLYWHEWSPGQRSLHVFPLYSQISDPSRRLDVVGGPLYVRDADRTPGGEISHSFLWPLIEKSASATGWHAHVLPIWWSTREGDSAFDLIAPLYLRSKTENTSHHWFLPIHGRYRHRSPEGGTTARDFYAGGAVTRVRKREPGEAEGKTSWSFLGPVAGFSRDVEERESHSRLLPVWWRTSSPAASTTVAFPLAYHQRRGQGADARTLTLVGGPLWVDSRTPERREFGVLYPLTRFRRSESSSSDQLFLLYGSSEDRSAGTPTARFRVSPLFSSSRGGDEPFYHWMHLASHHENETEERTRVLFFLYDSLRTAEQRRWSALGGLVRRVVEPDRERLTWVAPLYFSYQEGLDHDPDRRTTALLPFFYRHWERTTDETATSVFFPLFGWSSTGDGESSRVSILWPLIEYRRSQEFRSTRIFPFFEVRNWGSGARRFDLSVLYRRHHAAPTLEVGGLWSADGYFGLQLARSARGENTRTEVVHPFLFGYHRDDRADRVHWESLFQLAHYDRRGSDVDYSALGFIRGSKTSEREWHTTFPLYFSDEYHDAPLPSFSIPSVLHIYSRLEDRDESRWSLLGYLANGWSSKRSDDSEFRVLYRGVSWIQRGTYRERVIEPLFEYENDSRTGKGYLSFGKFLYIQRRDSRLESWRRYLLGIPLQW